MFMRVHVRVDVRMRVFMLDWTRHDLFLLRTIKKTVAASQTPSRPMASRELYAA